MSEKERDKEKRLTTIVSDLEIKKEDESSPTPAVSDPIVTHKPRVPYPQALDAPFSFKKDK